MKWYYLENVPNYIETVPSGFKENHIPLLVPKPDLTPQELVHQLKRYQPDVILTNGWTPFHREPYFQVLRRYCEETGSLHVFWSTEDPLHTDYWGMYVLETGCPDVVFTHSYDAPALYRERGVPSYYLPFACNPHIHRTLPPLPEYRSDVALVANFSNATMDSWRLQSLRILLEPLLQENLSLKIWGKGWERGKNLLPFSIPDRVIQGPIPYDRVPYVYASSKVVLGIQNHGELLTRRTWECIGTGGLLVTNHTAAVLRHFQPHRHLLTSRRPEETRSLVRTLLQNRPLRQQIATHGQQYVHQNHRYSHRVREMVEKASELLQFKRKHRRSCWFPAPYPFQEIRSLCTFTCTSPDGRPIDSPLLLVKRSRSVPLKDYRSGLLFSLESCLRNGFDVHQAQVKLFLAVHPSKNTAIKCQYFSAEEPPASPSCALTSEEETHTISIQMRKGEKPFQTPVILPVTALIRRLVRQKRQTFVVHLSIPPHDDGTVQFLGRQKPRNHPLAGLVYYPRFAPRLEIRYQSEREADFQHPWPRFVG
jgi:spore maturation protein CgeB